MTSGVVLVVVEKYRLIKKTIMRYKIVIRLEA